MLFKILLITQLITLMLFQDEFNTHGASRRTAWLGITTYILFCTLILIKVAQQH